MNDNVKSALTTIVFGLIFILVPVFAGSNISSVLGLILIIAGALTGINAYLNREDSLAGTIMNLIFGIVLLILGIIFVLNIKELTFIYSLIFYILGFIFILTGIYGYFSDKYDTLSTIISIISLILGII